MANNIDRMREALERLAKGVHYDDRGEGSEPNMGMGHPDTCVFCPSHIDAEGYERQHGRHIAHHPWCPIYIARVALGRDPEDQG